MTALCGKIASFRAAVRGTRHGTRNRVELGNGTLPISAHYPESFNEFRDGGRYAARQLIATPTVPNRFQKKFQRSGTFQTTKSASGANHFHKNIIGSNKS
jgi:hypothetical protein